MAAAVRAPSAENCQPWTFAWDGDQLSIFHDAARARKGGGTAFTDSCLGLGCVLESLAVAADDAGFQVVATPTVDDPAATRWATVRFVPGRSSLGHLVPTLARRCTDRRLFAGGSVDHPVFADILAHAARFSACSVHVLGRPPESLLAWCARAEALVWHHETLYRDVIRWLRLTQREVEETRDGAPWRAMGVDLPETRLLRLLRRPGARPTLQRLQVPMLAGHHFRRQVASSAALVLIAVPTLRRTDLVDAGRAMLATWLRLTEADFGVQPHSQPSLFLHESAAGTLPPEILPEFRAHFLAGRQVVADAFQLPAGATPVMLLRTGAISSLPAHCRAMRRSVEEVFRT